MDSKELSLAIEDFVNICGNGENIEAVADNLTYMHRTLQNSFISRFIIPFVRKCANDYADGRYDARNELALKICNDMWNGLLKDNPVFMECNNLHLHMI